MLRSKVGAVVEPPCERCGAPVQITKSYGESYFAGCSNPECRNIRQLTLHDVETIPAVFQRREEGIQEEGREGEGIDIAKKLNELVEQAMSWRLLSYTEESTREEFIDTILLALGWDASNSANVGIELKIEHDSVADYVLFNSNGEIFAIVEAKNLYEDLSKHEQQLFTYMEAASASAGILTNGFSWRVYECISVPKAGENPDIKMILSIDDILNDLTDETVAKLCNLIGFEKNYHSHKPKPPKHPPTSPLDDGWVET
jgi:hypothetical protein